MKRRFIFIFILVLAVCGCAADYQRITIIHTNDLHGHVLPEKVAGWDKEMGGYAVFSAWVKEVRESNREAGVPTLLFDGGDIFMGTPEGNISRGAAVIELMNDLGYDAMVLGNHEFDYGYDNLLELAESARFPILAANLFRENPDRPADFVRPFIIEEIGGLKVAILGVTTDETGAIALPENLGKLNFQDPVATVRKYRKILEGEGADLLIVLSHNGLEEDKKLAGEVSGIDLIIGGHSHDLLEEPVRAKGSGTLICQAGEYGRYAGRLDLRVDRQDDEITDYRYRIFVNRRGSFPPDPETDLILEEIKEKVGEDLDRVIGVALSDIISDDENESYLGDMITDAIRRSAGTEAAFQNAYGIRAPLLEGDITLRDIFKVLPFDGTIFVMKLSGVRIKELLEQSLTLKKGMLQMSGVEAEYDPNRPEGERLLDVRIDGKPLEGGRFYSVAVNGFLASGGDYYQAFKEGREIRDTGLLHRNAFRDYVEKNSPFDSLNFKPSRWLKK